VVALALKQRAKFEGWLKFELAAGLAASGIPEVRLEEEYRQRSGRADLLVSGIPVELKTCNTNYRVPGCENHHRPITRNIEAICDDCRRLARAWDGGIMAFAVFPVTSACEPKFARHVDKVKEAARLGEPPTAEYIPIITGAGLFLYVLGIEPLHSNRECPDKGA
jgi:hypothetical protein